MTSRLGSIGCLPPVHLVKAMGDIPDDSDTAREWWRAARIVEAYRLEADVADSTLLLDSSAVDPELWLAQLVAESTVKLMEARFAPAPADAQGLEVAL